MNKIIIPTGYMGSGSSAITDFLSEIEGYEDSNGDYEYVLMHCPNGIFDLEDKLLLGNNALRSDEAIYSFKKCMRSLYCMKDYWVSDYKHKISSAFWNEVLDYIDSLTDVKFDDSYWYFQEEPINCRMKICNWLKKVIFKLSYGRIILSKPLKYKTVNVSFVSKENFYNKTKIFLNMLYNDLGYNKHNLILDQFLLPHNLFRLDNYYGENVRVIVVDRDPRDVFILNKYIWKKRNVPVFFPLEVNQYCDFYRKMRMSERAVEDKRIIRIHFEDLIYNYDNMEKEILRFIGSSVEEHVKRKTLFNPEVSKRNICVFRSNEAFKEEIEIIEKKLKDYLYDFPIMDDKFTDFESVF